MAPQDPEASDQSTFSTWRRDYRLSLALFVAGIVLVVAYFAFGGWPNSTANYPTTFRAGLAIYLLGSAGGALILLAGTVAYYHWRGLGLIEGSG
ncbi:MAG: hypothetical protein WA691_05815 [Thermoplasmata archaeon]